MKQAERDLDTARLLRKEQRFDWASYAAAQSAEKAIKALLIAWGVDLAHGEQGKPWRSHKLKELFHAFRKLPTSQKLADAFVSLPNHDQGARYPDQATDLPPCDGYTEPQADQNIELAQVVVDFCVRLLPEIERAVIELGRVAATLVPP